MSVKASEVPNHPKYWKITQELITERKDALFLWKDCKTILLMPKTQNEDKEYSLILKIAFCKGNCQNTL